MNNALGVARAVRTRRKCRRDSHAAGGVFPAGKEKAPAFRWNPISRNASATRAENDSSRRAESLDARPSTLVPPVSASSPCRPRESSSSSEEQTSSKSDSDSESVSSKPPLRVASARAGSGERTPSDPRRREPSGPAGRDEGASPRSTICSARDGGECHREVSGVSGSALGGFRCAGCAMGSGCVPGASLGEKWDEGKKSRNIPAQCVPTRVPRRSLRPDPNERSEAVVVHRWTLLRPPTRSAWTASSATLGWTRTKRPSCVLAKIRRHRR